MSQTLTLQDNVFSQVKGLKWLPWIGDNYFSAPQDRRLLIVGESHYHDKTEQSINANNEPTFTRDIIEEMGIDQCYYGIKLFPNLHRTLFRNDSFDTAKFWNSVSFYNFIQRPMETNKGRPAWDDISNGWKVFAQLAEILQPNICLFIGTSSANSLNYCLQDTNYKSNGVKCEDWISNSYGRTSSITHKDGSTIQLVFIRHCSSMFSWDSWNQFLNKKIKEQLVWLEQQINGSNKN